MLDKYLDEQKIITDLLIKSLNEKKIVQAYLFVCDDINYIYDYAKDFTKEIVINEKMDSKTIESICKHIDLEQYNELKIVKPDGIFIKKEQLIELQKSVINKPVEGNKIVYIIKNADKLNSSSANTILKFLEEPEDDIIAILLTDNINTVLPTIKSRCQILNFSNIKTNDNLYKLISSSNTNLSNEEIENLISLSFEAILSIEKKKKNTIIYEKSIFWDNFKTSNDIIIMLDVFKYSYMDALYVKNNKEIKYLDEHKEIVDYLCDNNNIDMIVKKIFIIEKINDELLNNVNNKLLFDRLIIELSEV